MKIRFYLAMAAAALVMTNCSQEEELVKAPNASKTINATIEGASRSTVTDAGVFSWASGDGISVHDATNFDSYSYSGQGNGFTLSGTQEVTTAIVAYYPASERHTTTTFNLPTSYGSTTNEYVANTRAAMIAIPPAEGNNYAFMHLGGVMRFNVKNVPATATGFKFTASGKNISGSFEVKDNNGVNTIETTDGQNNTVSILFKQSENADGGEPRDMTFYIPMPVGEYGNYTVALIIDNSTIECESPNVTNTIARKTLLLMPTFTYNETTQKLEKSTAKVGVIDLEEGSQEASIEANADVVVTPGTNADATATLNYTPAQDGSSALSVSDGSGDTQSGESKGKVVVSTSENATIASCDINTPNLTVELSAADGTSVTYEEVTALTAQQTLIIGEGVTIKELIINGGNVRIEGGTVTEVENEQGKTITYVVEGAKDFDAIPEGVTEVELGSDITASEMIKLEKAITINGNNNTFTSTAAKAFEVYADATFKDITINGVERCVDTRKAVELTLNNVKLNATNSNSSQPLTIGGSEDGTTVTITNSEISAKKYAIITFVKTMLTATNSTISGYNALYVKPGSDGSVFNFTGNSTLNGPMGSYADTQGNSTSTIAIRDNNVSLTVDESSKVASEGNYCYALSLDSTYPGETGPFTGVNVTIEGEVTGQLLAVDSFEDNTIQFKEEYKEKLTDEGYIVSEPANNGMVIVTGVAEGVLNETALHAAIVDGANVSLGADIVLTKAITIPVGITATINLNGFNITAPDSDAFIVEGTLTINDENNEGVVTAGSSRPAGSVCAVWANGGTVTINGGHYKVHADHDGKRNDCIYAGHNADNANTAGTITINGGKFEYVWPTEEKNYTDVDYIGDQFLLNCANSDDSTTKITVNGGEFKNHVPSYEDTGRTGEVVLGTGKAVYNEEYKVEISHIDNSNVDTWYKVTETSGGNTDYIPV